MIASGSNWIGTGKIVSSINICIGACRYRTTPIVVAIVCGLWTYNAKKNHFIGANYFPGRKQQITMEVIRMCPLFGRN